jgi:hypothetical protein
MAIGRDLLNVPMGDMIRQMAFAIADAQVELDEASIKVAQMMAGQPVAAEDGGEASSSLVRFDGEDMSMMELGFTPTFYQFVDTIIEVKIAIKITSEREYTNKSKGRRTSASFGRRGFRVTSTPVDATYSSKYSYSAEGSSLLRTKLAPIPAPAILEERIRAMIEKAEAG